MTVEFVSEPNIVMNALAGTGKTTTIKMAVRKMFGERLPDWFVPTEEQQAIIEAVMKEGWPGRTHMTSFSTDATEQLQENLPEGVTSSSTYGMGLSIAKRCGYATKVDRGNWKYGRILTEFMIDNWGQEDRWTGLRMDILALCDKARLELYRQVSPEQLQDLADHYGIEIPYRGQELFVNAINHMLTVGLQQSNEFDYVDMVWIPCLLGMVEKQYDHLFVDEYQDMGKAQQEICYRISRKIVAIGDPNQAIYGFIGADSNATQSFCDALGRTRRGVKVFPLTYTRRCPKTVVHAANRFVPELKALPEAPEGSVERCHTYQFNLKSLTARDMVICPTNAPLVSMLFKMSKDNIKGYIRKSEVIDKLLQYVHSHTKGIEELRTSIERMLDQTEGKRGRKADMQRDKYNCLKEIADHCTTTDQVTRTIAMMFPTREWPGAVKMSSIHRSKGQEAHRVIVWEVDRIGQYAELHWEKQQSRNLEYVAYTRSKNELVLAKG